MRVLRLTAENIKRLKVVDISIDPSEPVIEITGKNGQGKSSVLDAMFYAITGGRKLPRQPIRKGQDNAEVTVDLGELKVTRRFTEKGTSLVVTNSDGARFPSPQGILDSLHSELSFDPLEFSRLKPEAQYGTLKDLAGPEIEKLEGANQKDYDLRTDINRRAKEAKARAAGMVPQFEDSTKPVDIAKLTEKLQKVITANVMIDREVRDRETEDQTLTMLRQELKDLEAKVKGRKPVGKKVDVFELKKEITEAEARNADVRIREEKSRLEDQTRKLEKESEDITDRMTERDKKKQELIEKLKIPIKGLSLIDGQVNYNLVPFDQCSTAEQIRISFAIAMTLNPRLRVIRIKEGSLLDDESMNIVTELAAKHDYQVWIERIEAAGRMAVLIEDGEVVM
jgi:DNA repair exonuclease SbcCD ATPase subunit